MAAQDAQRPADNTSDGSILANGLKRVLAAGGFKATVGAEQRRDAALIETDAEDRGSRRQARQPLHRNPSLEKPTQTSDSQLPIDFLQ